MNLVHSPHTLLPYCFARSWEDKLERARRMQEETAKAMEAQGICLYEARVL